MPPAGGDQCQHVREGEGLVRVERDRERVPAGAQPVGRVLKKQQGHEKQEQGRAPIHQLATIIDEASKKSNSTNLVVKNHTESQDRDRREIWTPRVHFIEMQVVTYQ